MAHRGSAVQNTPRSSPQRAVPWARLLEEPAEQALGYAGDTTALAEQSFQRAGITIHMFGDQFGDHGQQHGDHTAGLAGIQPYLAGKLALEQSADIAQDSIRPGAVLRAAEEVHGIVETETIAATEHLGNALRRCADGTTGLLLVQAELAHELGGRLLLKGREQLIQHGEKGFGAL